MVHLMTEEQARGVASIMNDNNTAAGFFFLPVALYGPVEANYSGPQEPTTWAVLVHDPDQDVTNEFYVVYDDGSV